MKTPKRKTRPAVVGDFVCPVHKKTVRSTSKWLTDEKTGRAKFGGKYYPCPEYHECRYYVSYNHRVPIM